MTWIGRLTINLAYVFFSSLIHLYHSRSKNSLDNCRQLIKKNLFERHPIGVILLGPRSHVWKCMYSERTTCHCCRVFDSVTQRLISIWTTNCLQLYVQNGDTALHIAALCHKSKAARLLVDAGCSCKLKNKVITRQL